MNDILHVVAGVSNPAQWKSRYALAKKFVAHMRATPGVKLHFVEVAGVRGEYVLAPDLALFSTTAAWLKESMVNVAVRSSLPGDWKYVMWVDADMTFLREGWAEETVRVLASGDYDAVQPWTWCRYRGPKGEPLELIPSWAFDRYRNAAGASGGAWACTREYWERVGGLPDWGIVGGCDSIMLLGMLGGVDGKFMRRVGTPAFMCRCLEWQEKAEGARIGYVGGEIEHGWHGQKRDRQYLDRWRVLYDFGFDPYQHVAYDGQGLIYITDAALERKVREYMVSRREDS